MKTLITLTLLIVSTLIHAQTHSIGAKAGVSFTNITNLQSTLPFLYKVGAIGGFGYEVQFKNTLVVSTGLMYNSFGFDNQFTYSGDTYKSSSYYDYLSIPIKFGFQTKDKVFAFGNLGIAFSLLINQNGILRVYDPNGVIQSTTNSNGTDLVTKFDFLGMVEFGVGYKINDKFCLYNSISFRHSVTETKEYPSATGGHRNYGISLILGFKYTFQNKTK